MKSILFYAAMIASVIATITGVVSIYTYGLPFDESKIEGYGYFYFQSDSCIQKAQFLEDLSALKKYVEEYSYYEQAFKNGVRISSGLFLNPKDRTTIHGSEFINDSICRLPQD